MNGKLSGQTFAFKEQLEGMWR